MSSDYVERRDDGYAVTGSRVSLDSIVCAFVSGESTESISQAHRNEIDRCLEQRRREFDTARETARDSGPMFYHKLADAKKQTPLAR